MIATTVSHTPLIQLSFLWVRHCTVTLGALACAVVAFRPAASQESVQKLGPEVRITADNRLEFPANYREWTFLSAGRGMSYGPSANPNGPPVFDNVFVNPAAYQEFMKTGYWPDRTIFMLEIRSAATEGSINKGGQFQKEVVGLEAEVKDKRFTETNGWGFFEFASDHKPAQKLAKTESCYACHAANGAVEQTFVQFYPTLVPVETDHKTLKK